MSDKPIGLHTKLVKVMGSCAYVQKQGQAKFGKFAGDEDIMRKINPALVEHGISSHVTDIQILATDHFETQSGSIWQRVMLRLVLRLVDAETGESVDLVGLGEGADPQDKAVYKAMTGARKYAWRLALNMATGDDPDASEADEHAVAEAKPQPRPLASVQPQQHRTVNAARASHAEPAFRFGKNLQGKPMREGTINQLRWYVEALERSILDQSKAQWRKRNEEDLAVAVRFLAEKEDAAAFDEEDRVGEHYENGQAVRR